MWNKTGLRAIGAAALLAGTLGTGTALAGNLEPSGINLGNTSFFDGFGPVQPGWTYMGYYGYSQFKHIEGNDGNDVAAFKNPSIDGYVMINQLVYTTHQTFFGGTAHLGFDGILPLLHFNTSFDAASPVTLSATNGLGDLTFGSYLQFDPVIKDGRPVYSQRVEFDLIAPTGRYSQTADINPSANFWSINPYWAATWLPMPRTELSWRLNYLYNFANSSPNNLPSTVTKTKAGQAAWVNFTASYAVKPNLSIGLNGYYFKQFTNDVYDYSDGTSDNGLQFGDTGKAEIFAIGPGVYWKAGPTNMWSVNLYLQTQAKNHTRGNVLNVHWIHPF